MEGRQICQWDKDSCADAGFLKIDLLGLGMLSAVEECVDLIAETRGRADRPLPGRLRRPRRLRRDPGRRHGRRVPDREPGADAVAAPDAAREPGRPDRAGGARAARADRRRRRQPLHQAPPRPARRSRASCRPTTTPARAGAGATPWAWSCSRTRCSRWRSRWPGFTTGEAESLRRAMSRKRSRDALERHWQRFRDGRGRHGASTRRPPRAVFEKVVAFSEFGFPKSHAAAFAILAYQSAWLHRSLPGRVPVLAPERAADGLLPAGDAAARRRAAGRRDAARRT